MNIVSNVTKFILISLYFIFVQDSNASNILCNLSITPVNIDPLDIEQIVSFVQSQEIDAKLIDDAAVTEIQTIREALEYSQGLDNEDINLSITELIQKYGFVVEVYTVTTSDGYVLIIHRIPGNGSSVFLMHGILGSSDDYVTAGPDSALAYLLAKAGYDVWMGNARGNKHSRQHITKSPECADFWEFSWHEIGLIDLPTMIDFVLAKTGRKTLNYVGYSQGTTTFFVMTAELPEYNDKINVMIALAPVAYMSHLKSPIVRTVALEGTAVYTLLKVLGQNEFLPDNLLTQALSAVLCGNNPLAKIVCSNFLSILCGLDRGQMNITNLPVVLSHTPAGSSTKQLLHYGQEILSAKFRQFDFGKDENLKVYGSEQPPDYVLENIRAPVALFHSNEDWFSNVTDVLILKSNLPNVIDSQLIPNYNHLDFLFASNVRQLVCDPIITLIEAYS